MEKVRKLVHALNYDPANHKGEVFTMPSLTTPNQAMTPAEVLTRFAQGRPLSESKFLSYTGDQYLPEIRGMDPVDLAELNERNKAHIAQLEQEKKDKLMRIAQQRRENNPAYQASQAEKAKGKEPQSNEQKAEHSGAQSD